MWWDNAESTSKNYSNAQENSPQPTLVPPSTSIEGQGSSVSPLPLVVPNMDFKQQFQQQQSMIEHIKESLKESDAQWSEKEKQLEMYASKLNRIMSKKEKNVMEEGSLSAIGKMNELKKRLEENKAKFEENAEKGRTETLKIESIVEELRNKVQQQDLSLNELQKSVEPSFKAHTLPRKAKHDNKVKSKYTQTAEMENRRIKELEAEVVDLKDTLKEKDSLILARTKAVTLLTKDLAQKGKTAVDDLEQTRSEMRSLQLNFVVIENQLKTELLEKDNRLAELDEKILHLQRVNEEKETEVEELKRNLGQLREEVPGEDLREIEKLKKELEDSNKLLIKMKLEYKNKLKAVSKQQQADKNVSARMEELEREREELSARIAELEEEKGTVENLKSRIAELESVKDLNKQYEDEVKQLKNINQDNSIIIDNLNARIEEFARERNLWEDERKTIIEEYNYKVKSLEMEINGLADANHSQQQEILLLNSQISGKQEFADAFELNTCRKQIDQLIDEKQELIERLKNLSTVSSTESLGFEKIEGPENETKNLKATIENLTELKDRAIESENNLQKKYLALENQNLELDESCERLRKEIIEAVHSLSQEKVLRNRAEESLRNLLNVVANLEERVAYFENANLFEQLEYANVLLSGKDTEIFRLQNTESQLEEQIDKLQKSNLDIEEKVKEEREKSRHLAQELEDLKVKLKKVATSLKKKAQTEEQLKKSLSNMEIAFEQQKQELLDNSKLDEKDLINKIKQLEGKLIEETKLKNHLEVNSHALNVVINELQEKVKSSEEAIDHLRKMVSEKQQILSDMEMQFHGLQQKNHDLENCVKELENTLRDKVARLENFEETTRLLQEELQRNKELLLREEEDERTRRKKLEKYIKKLDSKLSELTNELKTKDALIVQLENCNREDKELIEKLQAEKNQVEENLQKVRMDYEEIVVHLQEQLNKKEEHIQQLESDLMNKMDECGKVIIDLESNSKFRAVLESAIQELENKLKMFEKEKGKLEEALKSRDAELENLKETVTKIYQDSDEKLRKAVEDQKSVGQSEKETFLLQLMDLEEKCAAETQEKEMSLQSTIHLEHLLKEKTNEVCHLEEAKESLEKENEDLRTRLSSMKKMLEESENTSKATQQELKELQNAYSEACFAYEELQQRIHQTESDKKQLQMKFDEEKSQYEEKICQHEKFIADLQKEEGQEDQDDIPRKKKVSFKTDEMEYIKELKDQVAMYESSLIQAQEETDSLRQELKKTGTESGGDLDSLSWDDGWGADAHLEEMHIRKQHYGELDIQTNVELKSQMQQILAEKTALEEELNDLKVKNSKLVIKLKRQKTVIDKLNENVVALKSKESADCGLNDAIIDELKLQIGKFEQNEKQLKSDLESNLKKIELLQVENSRALETKNQQDKDINSLRLLIDQLQASLNAQTTVANVVFDESVLGAENKDLRNAVEALEWRVSELNEALEEKHELLQKMQEEKTAYTELETKYKDLDQQLTVLVSENDSLQTLLNNQKASKPEICDYFSNKTQNADELETANQNLRAAFESSEHRLSEALEEKQALLERMQEEKSSFVVLEGKYKDLEQQFGALVSENDSLQALLSEQKKSSKPEKLDYFFQSEEKEQLNVEMESLKMLLYTKDTKLNELSGKFKELEAAFNNSNIKVNSDLQNAVESLKWKVSELNEAMEEKQKQLKQYILDKPAKTEHQVFDYFSKAASYENESLHQRLNDSAAEIKLLKTQLSDVHHKFKELEGAYKDSKSEIERLLNEERYRTESPFENDKLSLEASLKEKVTEISDLKKQNDEKSREISGLKNLAESYKKQSYDLEMKLVQAENEIERLQETNSNTERHFAQIQEEIGDLQSKVTDLMEGLNEKERQIKILQEEKSSIEEVSNSKIKELEENIERLEIVEQNLQKVVADLEENLKIKENEIADLTTTLEEMRSEVLRFGDFDKQIKELQNVPLEKSVPDIELEEVQSLTSRLQSDLDTALNMLHQRDVRCEELTFEIMQLLEERDSLQLRLSTSLRQNEELRSKPSEKSLTENLAQAGPRNQLEEKLTELHTVGYSRDKTIQDESLQRHQEQVQLLSRISQTEGRDKSPKVMHI